jgi:hypothetical protein
MIEDREDVPLSEQHWHLKKEVSIATLGMIAANLVLVVMFFSSLDSRITALETQNVTDSRLVKLETQLRAESIQRDALETRTLRSLDEIKELLKELNRELKDRK